MLPLVLGGIALAAVGYGVKEFCESEGCPWDEEPSYTPTKKENIFELLYRKKSDVYDNSFKLLEEQLSKIKNLKNKPSNIWTETLTEETLACTDLTSEIKLYAETYDDVLSHVNNIVKEYIQHIETMMHSSLNYKHYSKEEKKYLKQMYKFMQEMQGLFTLNLLDEHGAMSVESILALRTYKEKTEKRYAKGLEKIFGFSA